MTVLTVLSVSDYSFFLSRARAQARAYARWARAQNRQKRQYRLLGGAAAPPRKRTPRRRAAGTNTGKPDMPNANATDGKTTLAEFEDQILAVLGDGQCVILKDGKIIEAISNEQVIEAFVQRNSGDSRYEHWRWLVYPDYSSENLLAMLGPDLVHHTIARCGHGGRMSEPTSPMRTIDTEHNWFWRQGYRAGLDGQWAMVPDEVRNMRQRSDYFAGHEAGQDDRLARPPT
jgi:hypothetical protein